MYLCIVAGSSYQPRLKPIGTDVGSYHYVKFLIIIKIVFSQIFSRTVASENQEALSDWLKHASPEGIIFCKITLHT